MQKSHLGTIPQLCRAISSQGMCRQSEKNLLSSNICSICAHNMVNFGPLAAEIVSGGWGTPANGFRVLAACTACTCTCSSGRQPNFAALNNNVR